MVLVIQINKSCTKKTSLYGVRKSWHHLNTEIEKDIMGFLSKWLNKQVKTTLCVLYLVNGKQRLQRMDGGGWRLIWLSISQAPSKRQGISEVMNQTDTHDFCGTDLVAALLGASLRSVKEFTRTHQGSVFIKHCPKAVQPSIELC